LNRRKPACLPFDLSLEDLGRTLSAMATRQTDLGDIYLQSTLTRSLRLESGRVSGGSFSQIEGFGLRGAKSAQVAFAHSADLAAGAQTGGTDGWRPAAAWGLGALWP
jgi:predicted Zn-dependent protease